MFYLRIALVGVFFFPIASIAESFSGKVVNSQNTPVAEIRLILLKDDTPISSTLTDLDGNYYFKDITPGTYQINIHALGFEQEQNKVTVEPGGKTRKDLTLNLRLLEENVVVTGTRTPSPRDFLGSSISIITSEEIHARRATTLGDVLRFVPGVTIAQNGGPGSVSSIFIRGGESNYTKVLLDGIPLNKPGGAIDLSNISLGNVDRIEVVRGPQSALYGSDAISGVIQIFSRRETEEKKPRFNLFLE